LVFCAPGLGRTIDQEHMFPYLYYDSPVKFTNLLNRTQLLIAQLRAAVTDASQTKTATGTNSNIVTLEERIMLSASPMALESVDAGSAAQVDIGDDGQNQPTQTTTDPQLNSEFGIEDASNASRQLIVIDSAVENVEELVAGLDSSAQVLLLDANSSGIEQITQARCNRATRPLMQFISCPMVKMVAFN